ncbi:hypothetical protein ACIRJM_05250 [Streptomyces sp. NPDC102405]|jgi:hypothetical protein|uniref:hypothetical protein n=1 Tax=Streptomyces sp. NPDC102405 TaxID=3366170 RepID=UPI00381BF77C
MSEMGLGDTHGILARPGVRPVRTSAGLGWERLYVSTQRELPYRDAFQGAGSNLVILHLDGPVTVRRGRRGLTAAQQVPPGGLFLHPAATELDVELGGYLNTVHVYLSDSALQATAGRRLTGVGVGHGGGIRDLLPCLVESHHPAQKASASSCPSPGPAITRWTKAQLPTVKR